MKKALLRAASNFMIEICKDKDLQALGTYLNYLSDMYGREVADQLNNNVIVILSTKYPDTYNWLVMQAKRELPEEETNNYITIEDLVYLLITEGNYIKDVDFKINPLDEDRLILTTYAYEFLCTTLTDIYLGEDSELEIRLNDFVEVVDVL